MRTHMCYADRTPLPRRFDLWKPVVRHKALAVRRSVRPSALDPDSQPALPVRAVVEFFPVRSGRRRCAKIRYENFAHLRSFPSETVAGLCEAGHNVGEFLRSQIRPATACPPWWGGRQRRKLPPGGLADLALGSVTGKRDRLQSGTSLVTRDFTRLRESCHNSCPFESHPPKTAHAPS